jgi:hypothetical protein
MVCRTLLSWSAISSTRFHFAVRFLANQTEVLHHTGQTQESNSKAQRIKLFSSDLTELSELNDMIPFLSQSADSTKSTQKSLLLLSGTKQTEVW